MPKHLVIVESPAKARTIERYLGEDYRSSPRTATSGTCRRTRARASWAWTLSNDFAPDYVRAGGSSPAGRPDRAGGPERHRGLARHRPRPRGRGDRLARGRGRHVPASKTHRVTFNEITEGAIRAAFASPRDIDRNLVDAQQARRIVDRLVGYTLSPLLSRKVRGGAVRRARPVRRPAHGRGARAGDPGFTAREYWTLEALLHAPDGTPFTADVRPHRRQGAGHRGRGRRRAPCRRDPRDAAGGWLGRHAASKRNPAPPFTTSTLQQEASRKLGFSPSDDVRRRSGCTRAWSSPKAMPASSPTCGRTRPRSPGWRWPRRRP